MVGGLSGQRMLIGLLIGIIVTGGSGLKDQDSRISRADYECGHHRTGGRNADGECNIGKTARRWASSTRLQPASAVRWEASVLLSVSVS